MRQRPKLTLKNFSYLLFVLVLLCLLFWLSVLTSGCVTVNKETNVFVIDPVIQVEVEVK